MDGDPDVLECDGLKTHATCDATRPDLSDVQHGAGTGPPAALPSDCGLDNREEGGDPRVEGVEMGVVGSIMQVDALDAAASADELGLLVF